MAILSQAGSIQGTGIYMQNCNQIHIQDCWISAFDDGILQDTQCTDGPFINNVITEYNHNSFRSINCDKPFIVNCDFWQTAGGGDTYNGVIITSGAQYPGDVKISGTRFVGYRGASIKADGKADVSDCDIVGNLGGVPIQGGAYSQDIDNRFTGEWDTSCISVGDRAQVSHNRIESYGNSHAEIRLTGTRALATGNYVAKTSTASNSDNFAILSTGTQNYISDNYCDGSSSSVISATNTDIVKNNIEVGAFVATH
jgi:hypothetical protein